jgi:Tol biopolymer transport system component
VKKRDTEKVQGKRTSTQNSPLLSAIFIWFLLLIIPTLLVSCTSSESSEEYKRNHPTAHQINVAPREFAPGNNDMLLFDYSTVFWSKIATYNLKTKELKLFDNIPIKQVTFPMFAPDGQKIGFIGAHDEYGDNRNIYIMNADGSEIRQITDFNFTGQKKVNLESSNKIRTPSFSPDGKRILYAKSHFKREMAYPLKGIRDDAWDVYELDVATGVERRLTRYDFYDIGRPHYMPDGKRFIFSAEGPVNTTGRGPKNFREYEQMYQKNFIFIMDGVNNELKPAFTHGNYSEQPSVSVDGSIFFISETTAKESPEKVRELFIYRDGKIKQLTHMDAWVQYPRLSRDGKYVLFVKRTDKKSSNYSHWIMKPDGTALKEIEIPRDMLKR